MDETTMVRLAQKGNREACEQLLRDHYRMVSGYLLRVTLNTQLAEDLTQETMLRAILNIKRWQPRAQFSTWLITIAHNLYRDVLKKNRSIQLLDEYADYRPEPTFSVEETAIGHIEQAQLRQVLAGLPYEKRAVLILKHYHGLKYEEIAKILGCPVGTVRSRLHYCITFIKQEMERRGWNERGL